MASTGARGSRPVPPTDLTGKLHRQQVADKKARDEAAGISPDEIRRQALREGIDAGFDAGYAAGWDALADFLRETGLDVDSILSLNDTDAGEAE